MRTAPRLAIGLALIIGPGLVPAAASAATHSAHTMRALAATSSGPGTTTVTFAVNVGALSITAPASASLGSGDPGGTITGNLGGNVVVTDNRAMLAAAWTATALSTDFITGSSGTLETIPVADATYNPVTITHTGTITTTGSTITLSGAPQTVVSGSGSGNNTAAWDPTIVVAVPAAAVGGTYTSTLTQSVS